MGDREYAIEQWLGAMAAHVHGVCDQLVRLNENVERLLEILEPPDRPGPAH